MLSRRFGLGRRDYFWACAGLVKGDGHGEGMCTVLVLVGRCEAGVRQVLAVREPVRERLCGSSRGLRV